MQPTDSKSRSSLARTEPITLHTRVKREYHFEWQPQSTFGCLVAVLLTMLLLISALMFSLMLMVGIAILILVLASIAFWKYKMSARQRNCD